MIRKSLVSQRKKTPQPASLSKNPKTTHRPPRVRKSLEKTHLGSRSPNRTAVARRITAADRGPRPAERPAKSRATCVWTRAERCAYNATGIQMSVQTSRARVAARKSRERIAGSIFTIRALYRHCALTPTRPALLGPQQRDSAFGYIRVYMYTCRAIAARAAPSPPPPTLGSHSLERRRALPSRRRR